MSREGVLQFSPNLFAAFAADYSGATTTTDIGSAFQRTIYAKELETYCKPQLFMENFAVVKRELINERAKTIRIMRANALTADGDLTEGTSLIGNEEDMSYAYVDITPSLRGNAVAPTALAMAVSVPDLRKDAIELLGDWAAQKIEKEYFKCLKNGMSSDRIITPGDKAVSSLGSADKLTTALISKAKQILKANNVPAFDPKTLKPTQPDNGYYVMVVRPEQMYDLVTGDSTYKTAAAQAALVTAKDVLGPNWKGFAGFWDGVLIKESTLTDFTDESGAYSVKVAKAFIFGARAYARAIGKLPGQQGDFLWRERVDDYGLLHGFAVLWYDGYKVINPRRVWGVYTAATELPIVKETGTK